MPGKKWATWLAIGLCAFIVQVAVIHAVFSGGAEPTKEKLSRTRPSTETEEGPVSSMVILGTRFTEALVLKPYEVVRNSILMQGVTLASYTSVIDSLVYHKKGAPCFSIPLGAEHVFISGAQCQAIEETGPIIIAEETRPIQIIGNTFEFESTVYCKDCAKTTPCTEGGTGALAIRVDGAWSCGPQER